MPALPTGIITQLTGGEQPKPRLKQAYLVVAEAEILADAPPFGRNKIAFQYWPESVVDSRQVEWNPRAIPGGSHPIYQWTHSGERRISFTAVFTNDFEPEEEGEGHDGLVDTLVNSVQSSAASIGLAGSPPKPGELNRQVDVSSAISWLRWFTYPYYELNDIRVHEPAKIQLVFPGSKMAYNGQDDILCVMTNCEVTYEVFFTNGAPRIAEVALEFAEVVQSGERVRFHSRSDMGNAGNVTKYLTVNDEGGGSTTVAEDIAGAVSSSFGL